METILHDVLDEQAKGPEHKAECNAPDPECRQNTSSGETNHELCFKSALSLEEIEDSFNGIDIFSGIMAGLEDALICSKEWCQPRDPKRIKEFCNQLAEVWENNFPDLRFGQLLCNVYGIQEPLDFFYKEDDVLLAQLTEYAEKAKAKASVMEELIAMESNPDLYKRYSSFRDLAEEVFDEDDSKHNRVFCQIRDGLLEAIELEKCGSANGTTLTDTTANSLPNRQAK